jgi:hypothetical protein
VRSKQGAPFRRSVNTAVPNVADEINRFQRAAVAAAAIAPATLAGIALIRCGCGEAAWTIEIAAAVIFSL